MGSEHSKSHKEGSKKNESKKQSISHLTRKRHSSSGSLAFSADSLDLIYIDDYFDDARYLKRLKQKSLLAKRLSGGSRKSVGRKSVGKALSDSSFKTHTTKKSVAKPLTRKSALPISKAPTNYQARSIPPYASKAPISSNPRVVPAPGPSRAPPKSQLRSVQPPPSKAPPKLQLTNIQPPPSKAPPKSQLRSIQPPPSKAVLKSQPKSIQPPPSKAPLKLESQISQPSPLASPKPEPPSSQPSALVSPLPTLEPASSQPSPSIATPKSEPRSIQRPLPKAPLKRKRAFIKQSERPITPEISGSTVPEKSKVAPPPKTPIRNLSAPPSSRALPPVSLSTGALPQKSSSTISTSVVQSDKIAQTHSWHGPLTTSGSNTHASLQQPGSNVAPASLHEESGGLTSESSYAQQGTQLPSIPIIRQEETSKAAGAAPSHRPRSILTASQPRSGRAKSTGTTVKSQRSYIVSTPAHGESSLPPRSQSLNADWAPEELPIRPETSFQQKRTVTDEPKKKLVVRGLKNFVNTHKRDSFRSSFDSSQNFAAFSGRGDSLGGGGGGGGGGPALWKREFPSKGKFHPDNFIYDWGEGPNAPPRPLSAMAKCKKKGGRCNDCGLFTVDLCQSCKKCETDCACPPGVKAAYSNPYTPKEVYQEVFGGDGWNKACKVLCSLTEQDKRHPVGGNASKRKQNQEENWAKKNFYKSQIDVLNPYGVPLNDYPPPPPQQCPPMMPQPMCMPPMFPFPFMPWMMPPPMMMPFCPPPPPPPPCAFYDPCCPPPPPPAYPYPPSDSFMPNQNYYA